VDQGGVGAGEVAAKNDGAYKIDRVHKRWSEKLKLIGSAGEKAGKREKSMRTQPYERRGKTT